MNGLFYLTRLNGLANYMNEIQPSKEEDKIRKGGKKSLEDKIVHFLYLQNDISSYPVLQCRDV